MRFVLPAAIWTTLIAVTLFAYVHVHVQQFIQSVSISAPVIDVFEQYTGLTYTTGEEFGLSAARHLCADRADRLSLHLRAGAAALPGAALQVVGRLARRKPRPASCHSGLYTHRSPTGWAVYTSHRQLSGVNPAAWTRLARYWRRSGHLGVGLWLLWRNSWMERFLRISV